MGIEGRNNEEKNQRGANKEWEAKSAGRHAEAFSSANGQYK